MCNCCGCIFVAEVTRLYVSLQEFWQAALLQITVVLGRLLQFTAPVGILEFDKRVVASGAVFHFVRVRVARAHDDLPGPRSFLAFVGNTFADFVIASTRVLVLHPDDLLFEHVFGHLELG